MTIKHTYNINFEYYQETHLVTVIFVNVQSNKTEINGGGEALPRLELSVKHVKPKENN